MTIYKGGEPYQISRRCVRVSFNYTDGAKFCYDSGYSNYITAPLYNWKSYWDYVKLDDSGGGDTLLKQLPSLFHSIMRHATLTQEQNIMLVLQLQLL